MSGKTEDFMDTSKFKEEFKQIEAELAGGTLLSPEELKEKTKRHAFLSPIVEKISEIEKTEQAIKDDKAIIEDGSDKEMSALAAQDLAAVEGRPAELLKELRMLVIPPDPKDSKNLYLEIRPGAGGEEAAINAIESMNAFITGIQRYCAAHPVEFKAYSPGEIKKYATGKGNAKKPEMIDWFKSQTGKEPDTDDESDAYALLRLVMNELSIKL
jgi:peptide chain release factor 1